VARSVDCDLTRQVTKLQFRELTRPYLTRGGVASGDPAVRPVMAWL
jgi:hypothetical protein